MRKGIALLFVLIVLAGLFIAYPSNVKAQSTNIYINTDGDIVGTNNIQRNGNLYVLTGNISGSIEVQKSNIIIDGAGYALEGYGGTGIDLTNNLTQYPSPLEIQNVTVENLRIMNFNFSINAHGSSGNTFYYDYIGNTTNDAKSEILLYWNNGGNNITHCTIMGTIGIELSSGNSITENNLLGGILLQVVGNETVDRNFWSDYLTRYPNATEIDSSGVGNAPYKIDIYTNGVVTGALQDNHALMKPISIPNFGIPQSSPSPTINPSPSIPEFPTWIILPLFAIAVLISIAFSKKKLETNDSGIPLFCNASQIFNK
ncbi:MAG TPA: hypothetical protein VLU95_00485 [Candidatus Acidoferrum sp.]|nr:hypothetical protein [Candidatus Acidoferrum sp.]